MTDYTIRDFAMALEGVIVTLDGAADQLKLCDQEAEIDNTPGWRAICQIPVIMGETCVAPDPAPETFRIVDLLETVEGIRDWIGDVRSKLGQYAPDTPIDMGTAWPRLEETEE